MLRVPKPRTAAAILLLINLIGCNKYDRNLAQANNQQAVSLACQLYYTSYGAYPADLDDPNLVPFLDGDFAPLDDEWGNPILYQPTDTGFTLTSLGPDERLETDDDIQMTHPEPDE